MASNSFNLTNQKADVVLTDGTNTIGMQFLEKTTLVESRGTSFAGNTNSGGTTYQDATPFKRKVWDTWIGGLGQAQENTTYGGTGAGGDPTKFLDADAHTRRTGYLLPNMRRSLLPTTTSKITKLGVGYQFDPDEFEIPCGILPLTINSIKTGIGFTFTTSTGTINNVRVPVYFNSYLSSASYTFSASIDTGTVGVYSLSIDIATAVNYTGWKWITLPLVSGTGGVLNNTSYTLAVAAPTSLDVALGCYIQDVPSGAFAGSNVFVPYAQLMKTSTNIKDFTNPVAKVEQLLNSTTYVNVALTTTTLFNTAVSATTAERALSGTYLGSIVFNNKLYVSTLSTNGTAAWDAAATSTNAAPTNAIDTNVYMFSMVEGNGVIYGVGAVNRNAIYKWGGNFPATGADAAIKIIDNGKIGQSGNFINALFIMGGFLYAIKPEGIYQIFRDPSKIDTTEVPPVDKLVSFPTRLTDTGRWWRIHQGMLFCNYKDQVWQIAFGPNGPQINILKPDFPRYRLNYYHYVNGLTSDGRNVYASWNNLGVYSYVGAGWHKEFEFYEQVAVEGQSSGLTWIPNPTSAPDYLFGGDGKTLVQLPSPNAYGPYTQQIFANNVNKCGYVMQSMWDGDLAEIVKYIQSVVLRAFPGGCRFKLVASIWQNGTSATSRQLVDKAFLEGLLRDNWTNPTVITSSPAVNTVVTTKIDSAGLAIANTLAPACWVSTDFDNAYYSSEKLATSTSNTTADPDTTDVLANPAKLVQTTFILYFWNPTPGQASTVGQEVMSVDSLSVKYQPIQDYLPVYQFTIDVDSLIMEQTSAETNANVNAAVTQVRAWAGRHSPVQAQVYTSEGIKTVNCFIQDARFEYDPIAGGGHIEPLPKRLFLTLIGTDPEYQGT